MVDATLLRDLVENKISPSVQFLPDTTSTYDRIHRRLKLMSFPHKLCTGGPILFQPMASVVVFLEWVESPLSMNVPWPTTLDYVGWPGW